MHKHFLRALLCCGLLVLGACATLSAHAALQVTVAGIEAMPEVGEGMEMRFVVKLRVQNPNDLPLDYDGVAVNLDVQGRRFASGVSDVAGAVPGFGETVIAVPVTVSVLRMVRQVVGMGFQDAGGGRHRRQHQHEPALTFFPRSL